jgi:replicative DNA helicase
MNKAFTAGWAAGEPLPDLPHSLEAEQAFLGALVASEQSFVKVADGLRPEDFYESANFHLFSTMSGMLVRGEKINIVALVGLLANDPAAKSLNGDLPGGWKGYLAHIASGAAAPIALPDLAGLIKRLAQRRQLIVAGEALVNDALIAGHDDAVERIGAEASEMIAMVIDNTAGSHTRCSAGKAAEGVIDRIARVHGGGTAGTDLAYPGSERLAWALGGWRRKRFYVLAGRPGMGKTSCLSFLTRTARKGHGVLVFSMEMDAQELTERLLSDLSWTRERPIPYADIAKDFVSPDDLRRLADAKDRLAKLPFIIDDRPGLALAQIKATARLIAQQLTAQGLRLDVIVIDHLGLLSPTDRYKGNKVAETEEASAAMKMLAKELDCAVIAMVQLNRGVEGREEKRPTLADLRWSGAIEQDADVVLLLYRPAYYLSRPFDGDEEERAERVVQLDRIKNLLEINIAKQRGGGTPSLEFFTDIGCSVIRDLELHR